MTAIPITRAYLLGLSMIFAGAAAQAQDIVIVANESVHVPQVSPAELRDIFTGVRSRLEDGSKAVPVLLKGGPAHEVFLRNHVGDSVDEFRARWRKAVFTGQGSMPREFSSEAALLEYIAVTPGTIGYVSRAAAGNGVKVLIISPK